jgi:hypothetical protein
MNIEPIVIIIYFPSFSTKPTPKAIKSEPNNPATAKISAAPSTIDLIVIKRSYDRKA